MFRIRAWFFVAACSVSLTGAAVAQPRQPTTSVTIVGAHGGYADFTLARDSAFTKDPFGKSSAVTGGRTYAGACLVPFNDHDRRQGIASAPCIGTIARVPAIAGVNLLLDTARNARLPAGRYRMYLFTDGPAKVTVATPGEPRSLALAAGGPPPEVSLTFAQTGLNVEVARRQLRAPVPASGVTWAGWSISGVAPAATGITDFCATNAGAQCIGRYSSGDRGFDFTSSDVHGSGGSANWTSFGPDHPPAYNGAMDVFFTEAYTDVTTSVLGWVLSVDFGSAPLRR